RVGELQVLHQLDELLLRSPAAETRVVLFLFAHRRHGEALVVMPRIEQALVGQREDLVVDRSIKRLRIALLKIGPAGATDQERISREGHRPVAGDVGDAAVGMARSLADLELVAPETDAVAVLDVDVGTTDTRPF